MGILRWYQALERVKSITVMGESGRCVQYKVGRVLGYATLSIELSNEPTYVLPFR